MWCIWWGWGEGKSKWMFSLVLWCLCHCATGVLLTLSIFFFIIIAAEATSISSCHVINDSKAKWFEKLNICFVSWRLVGWTVLLMWARLRQACMGTHSWICCQLQVKRWWLIKDSLGRENLAFVLIIEEIRTLRNWTTLYMCLPSSAMPYFANSYKCNLIIQREDKGSVGASWSK